MRRARRVCVCEEATGAHRSGVVNLHPTLYCSMVIWSNPLAFITSLVATNARSVDSTNVPSTSHRTPIDDRTMFLMLRTLEDWSPSGTGCRTASARSEDALGCDRLQNSGKYGANTRIHKAHTSAPRASNTRGDGSSGHTTMKKAPPGKGVSKSQCLYRSVVQSQCRQPWAPSARAPPRLTSSARGECHGLWSA